MDMKIKLLLSLLLSMTFVEVNAADSSYTGKIESIHTSTSVGSVVFLILPNDQSNKANCATNTYYNYAFDSESPSGKAMLSIILGAFFSGKDVYIGGSGTDCTHYTGVEDLRWLRVL